MRSGPFVGGRALEGYEVKGTRRKPPKRERTVVGGRFPSDGRVMVGRGHGRNRPPHRNPTSFSNETTRPDGTAKGRVKVRRVYKKERERDRERKMGKME